MDTDGRPRSGNPYGYGQPAPQPPRRSWVRRHKVLTGLGIFAALMVIGGITSAVGSPTGSAPVPPPHAAVAPDTPAAAAPAAQTTQAAPPAAETVTYVVSGSDADVTYGPAGSNLAGTVPMRVTKPLGSPIYYAIDAQLQGGGSVSCEILVDGKVISRSTASGGYNIASCEISQDPFSGDWSDTNGQ